MDKDDTVPPPAENTPSTPEQRPPLVDSLIDLVFDGAAALAKSAVKSAAHRVAKSANTPRANPAVALIGKAGKAAKKAAKSPGKTTVKKAAKRTGKKAAKTVKKAKKAAKKATKTIAKKATKKTTAKKAKKSGKKTRAAKS